LSKCLEHIDAQPAQEPVCPACKAEVLYECVACSSNNYPPLPAQRPWVGLTEEDSAVVREEESCSFIAGAKWAEEILKGKNT
jgi:hypothetical protein